MGRDARPDIPPWRRRVTAADLDPEAVAAERRRIEAEQGRREREPELELERKLEPEPEREELSPGEQQKVREAVQGLHRDRRANVFTARPPPPPGRRYGRGRARARPAARTRPSLTRRGACVSLLHLGGMPWARIGELVGHDDLMTTAKTYTHVVADEAEPDYEALLEPPSGRLSAASAHRTR
jgi:integrase